MAEEKEKKPSPPLGSIRSLSIVDYKEKKKAKEPSSIEDMQNKPTPPEKSPLPALSFSMEGSSSDSVHTSSQESTIGDSKTNQKSSHAKILTTAREFKRVFKKKSPSESSFSAGEEPGWVRFTQKGLSKEEVYIHEQLYSLGITAFKEPSTRLKNLVESSNFTFNTRTLSFIDEAKQTGQPIPSSVGKTKAFLNPFQQFVNQYADRIRSTMIADSLPSTFGNKTKRDVIPKEGASSSVTDLILQYAADDDKPNTMVIFNRNRREEVFLPITVNKGGGADKFGLYVYPWLSKTGSKPTFTGFECFVTALCMFGTSLKGVDQEAGDRPLIKHEIKFFNGQQIEQAKVVGPSPFEVAQFEHLEKLAYLINSLSPADTIPQLHCHLPYYDYILFCLGLFLTDKITDQALEDAVKIILEKKKEYTQRINEICEKHSITATISSPFDNIFGEIRDYSEAEKVFERLTRARGEQLNEESLAQNCLELLVNNELQVQHRQGWRDYLVWSMGAKDGEKNISNLEDLFKAGNAVVVATASRDKPAQKVCSLLPLSEKQIQLSYAEFSKNIKAYPAVVNFTYLDPFLGYSNNNKGHPFYFNASQIVTTDLMSRGALRNAYRNAGTSPGGEYHKPLKDTSRELNLTTSEDETSQSRPTSPTKN